MDTQLFLKNTNILYDPKFQDKKYDYDTDLGSWNYNENYGDYAAGVKFGKIHGHFVYGSIGGGSGDNSVPIYNGRTELEYGKKYRVEIKVTGATYSGDIQYVQVGLGLAYTSQFHGNGIFTQELVCPYVADTPYNLVTILGRTDDTISSTSSTGFFIVQYCNITEVKEAELDLYDDVNLPLNFSIADIRYLEKRNSSYSKDFTIPGTKKNNRIFNHIFEIDSDSAFNPKKRIPCYVLQDGIEVFSGSLQLNGVDVNKDYDIGLVGKFANIFEDMGEYKLTDLDFSVYGHTYSKDFQLYSWNTSIIKDDIHYDNFERGPELYSLIPTFNYNGYLGITFSTSYFGITVSSTHNLQVGDTVNIHTTGTDLRYSGWYKVIATPTIDSIVLNIEYHGRVIAITYKINPKGEGYVYPFINYGTVVSPSGDNKLQWFVEDIYPAIYVKEYVDRIFEKIGYTYESTFFDSDYFKSLIVPCDSTTFRITKEQKEKRLFKATLDTDDTDDYSLDVTGDLANIKNGTDPIVFEGNGSGYFKFDNDSTNGNFDNGSSYNVLTGSFTVPDSGYYELETSCVFHHKLVFMDDGYYPSTVGTPGGGASPVIRYPNSISATITLHIRDFTGGVDLTSVTDTVTLMATGTFYQYELNLQTSFPSTYLKKGRIYKIRYNCSSTLVFPNEDMALSQGTLSPVLPSSGTARIYLIHTSYFLNNISNDRIAEGNEIELVSAVPIDVLLKDFFLSIVKMFNLYINLDKDNDRKLIIETRDTFYSDSDIVDWTDKLDTSRGFNKGLDIRFLSELTSNKYTFNYKDDKDWYNNDYQNNTKKIFGAEEIKIDTDIISGTTETKLVFSPTPLDDYSSGTSMILPNITKNGYSGTTGFNIRILFYGGLRFSSRKYYYTQRNPSLTSTLEDFYPYCGHLDNPDFPTQDLNFGLPEIIYQPKRLWTDNNLYNRFHRKTIEEISDKDSKLVTGYFYLTPVDIYNLDFKNQFYINGHYLRLNKIIDYNPNILDLTKCEFFKAIEKPIFEYGNIVERFSGSGSGIIEDSTDRTEVGELEE